MDDFSKLTPSEHMLRWLDDDPYTTIRAEVQNILNEQVPGAVLVAFRVVSEPQWLTGARPKEDDPDKAILVRTGVAFAFELQVDEPNGESHDVRGVYSWVGVHLDDPAKGQQRIWFDVDGSLEDFGSSGELQTRMYFA